MIASSSKNPASSLGKLLRRQGPERLAQLLRSRPDLASPTPSGLDDLVARSLSAASTARALAQFDEQTLRVVAGLVAEVDDAVIEAGLELSVAEVRARLDDLALAWDGELGRPVRRLFGPQPAGLAPASTKPMPPDRIEAALDQLSIDELATLQRMVWGPPYGTLERANRRIDPDAPATPIERLLQLGLLRPVDQATVILPREVALRLRGGRLHDPESARPALPDFAAPPFVAGLPDEILDALAHWLLGEVSTADWRTELEQAADQDRWVRLAHARDDGTLAIDVVRVLYLGQGSAYLVRRAGPRLSVPLARIISAVSGEPVVIKDLPPLG